MPSENQYSKAVLPLKGGLDFVDESLDANRGTLSDCLNWEVSDRLGYSRINGFERYHQGPYTSSQIYTNTVFIVSDGLTDDWNDYTIGEEILLDDPTYKGKTDTIGTLVGTTTWQDEDQVYLVGIVLVTDYAAFLSLVPQESILLGATSAASTTFSLAISYQDTNAATQTSALNTLFYANQLTVTAPNSGTGITTNGPITGLKWYKEHLYAITDYLTYDFTLGATEVFPGDVMLDTATGLIATRVVNINVTSGSWDAANAAGTVVVKSINGTPTGAQEVDRGGSYTAGLTITAASVVDSTNAGLFRTTDAGGWEEIDLGYELSFSNGTVNGPPAVYSRGAANSTVTPVTAVSTCSTASVLGAWALTGAATVLEAVTVDEVAPTYKSVIYTAGGTKTPAVYVQVKDFSSALGIPADSEITGIALTINGTGFNGDSKSPYFLAQPFDGITGQIGLAKTTTVVREGGAANTFSAADTRVIGGPGELWGITDIRTSLANGFGFNIAPRCVLSTGSCDWRINYVELTVYYSASVTDYYFYNGVDDVVAPITNYYVSEGDWTTDDARGFLQVGSITPYGSATRTYIAAGDQIWTAPGGTGARLADVENNAAYGYLPSLSQLQEQSSRYQMIVANFYGNEAWEAIYGVSGAGQAFVYDGFYFRHIYTGLSPSLDMPRHLAYNQGALALGYAAGNVTFSVPGSPENFDGILGATSIDLGDPVTGLVRMSGTALGVFCRGSISTVTGTNIDNYSATLISGAEGAIEYTAVDIGQPLYCSNKGISLIDQTAAYGGFLGGRLSEAITPWLLPRVQRTRNPLPASGLIYPSTDSTFFGANVGVLFATVCRSKNQYRLYFEDGSCLTLTLQGAAREPAFTIQRYDKWSMTGAIGEDVKYANFLPLACTSDIDDQGREHIFMSHYDSARDAANNESLYYAYEFENSWSFTGHPITFSMRLNENFLGDVFAKNKVAKVAAHGLSYGYAPLKLSVGVEYGQPGVTAREALDISMPRTPTANISSDLESVMNIADPAARGRSFNFKLFYPHTGDGVVCPPFSVQMLLIQYTEGKGDV